MSFLFKFIDSGFLLTFGLILLISGGIMLYCYRRLNLLEKSVIEHGKILQNFIINYNIQMQHFSLLNKSLHSTKNNDTNVETNRTEYVEFDKIKKINLGEKISVSDDEDDEDDEDEDDKDDDEQDDDEQDDDDDDDDENDDDDEDEDDEDEDEDEDDEDEDEDYEDEDEDDEDEYEDEDEDDDDVDEDEDEDDDEDFESED